MEGITTSMNYTFNTTSVSNLLFSNLKEIIAPILAIVFSLIGLYVIYLIIKFILNRIDAKRLKKMLENTELILKRLDGIEEKLSIKKDKKKSR